MKVETRDGGDGVLCWNVEAIRSYAAAVNEREDRLAQDNPDVEVHPGVLKCYGCEALEWETGTRCTATLTKTMYSVRGEVGPRAEDAVGSLNEVGMETRTEASGVAPETTSTTDQRKSGLRGLLRRG